MMASKRYIPKAVREQVRTEGKRRCAYCQVPEVMTYHRLEMEHIIPRFSGGTSEESNLCLSCRLCNESKGPQTHAKDPETGRTVALFHPKRQKWSRHFRWSADGTLLMGVTACGRATVAALKLNEPLRVEARRRWLQVGLHPLQDKA
jgi:hypothetical protein